MAIDFQNHCSFVSARYDMHLLAYYYHWSVFDLWKLPSIERRMWVNLIREQIKAENDANNGNSDPQIDETPKVGGKEYRES